MNSSSFVVNQIEKDLDVVIRNLSVGSTVLYLSSTDSKPGFKVQDVSKLPFDKIMSAVNSDGGEFLVISV